MVHRAGGGNCDRNTSQIEQDLIGLGPFPMMPDALDQRCDYSHAQRFRRAQLHHPKQDEDERHRKCSGDGRQSHFEARCHHRQRHVADKTKKVLRFPVDKLTESHTRTDQDYSVDVYPCGNRHSVPCRHEHELPVNADSLPTDAICYLHDLSARAELSDSRVLTKCRDARARLGHCVPKP